MNPVTARQRGPRRVDARRRQGGGHAAQRPTLFDAASAGVAARTDFGPATAVVSATAQSALSAMPGAGSGETLDRLVVSSWEQLVSHAVAPCLVCSGTMEPAYAAHAAPIGGRCRDCGTTLG